jgi:hypothetical protein
MLPSSCARLSRYERAWTAVDRARAQLLELGASTAADRPLAIAAMPQSGPGLPPNNPNGWFPLAERPFQPRDLPMVSLGYLTVGVPGSEDLLGDASGLRELWHAGAVVAAWQEGSGAFLTIPPPPPARGEVRLEPDGSGRFLFAAPTAPLEVEVVEVRTGAPPGPGRLRVLADVPLPAGLVHEFPLGEPADAAGTTRFTVDLSAAMVLPTLALVGARVVGFELDLPAPARAAATATCRPRVPELAAEHLAGRAVAFAELAARTPPPPAPPGGALRLVLLGPQGALALPVDPGTGRLAPATRAQQAVVAAVARLSRQDQWYCYWEALPGPGGGTRARSRLDRLALRP